MTNGPQIFTWLFSEIDGALNGYVFETTSNVVNWATPIFTGLLAVYLALWGWAFWQGQVQDTWSDFMRRTIKIAALPTFALSLGYYAGQVAGAPFGIADAIVGLPAELGGVMVDGDGASGYNFATTLDSLLGKGFDLGLKAWNAGGPVDLGSYIVAGTIWLATMAFTGTCGFLGAMAKIMTGILIPFGPVFILLIMFGPTRKFFESWLSQTLNYGFVMILLGCVTKVMFSMFSTFLSYVIESGNPGPTDSISLMLASIMLMGVVMQLPSVAASLAGGIALSTQGAIGRITGGIGDMARNSTPNALRKQALDATRNYAIFRKAFRGGAGG